jgi:serine/threonine protein kinase
VALFQPTAPVKLKELHPNNWHAAFVTINYQLICRKGITHRDLKPDNVMLTKSGTKLFDFGLTKLWLTSKMGTRQLW